MDHIQQYLGLFSGVLHDILEHDNACESLEQSY